MVDINSASRRPIRSQCAGFYVLATGIAARPSAGDNAGNGAGMRSGRALASTSQGERQQRCCAEASENRGQELNAPLAF